MLAKESNIVAKGQNVARSSENVNQHTHLRMYSKVFLGFYLF